MNKELIKKYQTEFDHWLNGGELLTSIDKINWEDVTDNNMLADEISNKIKG